jgi:hypothetical protein
VGGPKIRIKRKLAMLGVALAAAAVVPPALAAGQGEPVGLWGSDFSAHQVLAECGKWRLDSNGFCVANDSRNGLEVGVRFQTSRQVRITGIRIYRVEPADVTGSLWTAGGDRLARGTFRPGPTNAWQDLTFADPVTIVPGKTYVASYFTPGTRYAFRYGFFTNQALTVGPITGLRAVEGSPNGVFCYDDQNCGFFPVHGHRDSTYWVTPLWQAPTTDPVEPIPSPTITPPPPGGTPPGKPPTASQLAPRVSVVAPVPGATGVKVTAIVKATFSEPVRRATVSTMSVRLLRKGSTKAVPTRLSYDASGRRVVLRPRTALRHMTTYRVVVTTDVRDLAGNRLDQDHSKPGRQRVQWTFRTR